MRADTGGERLPHVIWVQLTVVGVAIGAIYALAGMGLVLTYKATGIFNFAYGGIAMLVAYMYWQMRSQWHWPLVIAAPRRHSATLRAVR